MNFKHESYKQDKDKKKIVIAYKRKKKIVGKNYINKKKVSVKIFHSKIERYGKEHEI